MLFKQAVLERIATGEITLAFRRWQRPSVKAGGTLLTAVGQLAIEKVETIEESGLTARDAKRAGFESVEELLRELNGQRKAALYRVQFRLQGADPRIALRSEETLSAGDVAELVARLDRLDAASNQGPWTRQVLALIVKHPERRAQELADLCRFQKEWLKLNVRKLKNLGLTESLNPGYRLSPRGRALLKRLK